RVGYRIIQYVSRRRQPIELSQSRVLLPPRLTPHRFRPGFLELRVRLKRFKKWGSFFYGAARLWTDRSVLCQANQAGLPTLTGNWITQVGLPKSCSIF